MVICGLLVLVGSIVALFVLTWFSVCFCLAVICLADYAFWAWVCGLCFGYCIGVMDLLVACCFVYLIVKVFWLVLHAS